MKQDNSLFLFEASKKKRNKSALLCMNPRRLVHYLERHTLCVSASWQQCHGETNTWKDSGWRLHSPKRSSAYKFMGRRATQVRQKEKERQRERSDTRGIFERTWTDLRITNTARIVIFPRSKCRAFHGSLGTRIVHMRHRSANSGIMSHGIHLPFSSRYLSESAIKNLSLIERVTAK